MRNRRLRSVDRRRRRQCRETWHFRKNGAACGYEIVTKPALSGATGGIVDPPYGPVIDRFVDDVSDEVGLPLIRDAVGEPIFECLEEAVFLG